MSTFGDLIVDVSRDMRDEDNKTFNVVTIGDLVNRAIAEVSRVAPARFREDITPVLNTFLYHLDSGNGDATTEVRRVEIWDASQTPEMPLITVGPLWAEPGDTSAAGWALLDGWLELPYALVVQLDPAVHIIRVWGYRPYPQLVNPTDNSNMTPELESAVRLYATILATRMLITERDLFTQWQTRANATDVTPAALMNGLNLLRDEWRRQSRAIAVLRVAP